MNRYDNSLPLFDGLLRCRHALLSALAGILLLASWAGTPATTDWFFFAWGSDTLFGADRDFVRGDEVIVSTGGQGLHLYAEYPFLQIGPPALLLARLLQWGPAEGAYLAGALVQALGLATLVLLERTVALPSSRRTHLVVLLGGAMLLAIWTGLAHTRHLDDALALSSVAAAAWAVVRRHPLTAGAFLGLAAASKPWAVVAVPMLLALTGGVQRFRAAAAAGACMAIFWGPFIVADTGTLRVGDVALPFALDSAPAALGAIGLVADHELRLVQLVGGLLLGTAVAALGGWMYAPLAAFSLRLLVDPFPYQYYLAGLVVAALLADLHWQRWHLPVITSAVAAGWVAVALSSTDVAAWVRLVLFFSCLIAAVLLSLRSARLSRVQAPG